MAQEEVAIKVIATTAEAEANLQRINETLVEQNQILVELERELLEVEQTQQATSKTNLAAQKALTDQANHLKNAIKDQRLSLKEINAERRTTKMALDSLTESSANQTKVIQAIDKLTGGYATKIKKLYLGLVEGAKGVKLFISGLSGVQKALIATGVGAFVVALGVIVAYWDEITEAINGTNKSLERTISLNDRTLTGIDNQIKQLETQKKILEANEQNTKGINASIEETILLRQEENRILIDNLKTQLEQQEAQARELTLAEEFQVSLLNGIGLREQAAKVAAKGFMQNDEERKKIEEINDKIAQAEQNQLNFQLKLANLKKEQREEESEKILEGREGDVAVAFDADAATKALEQRKQFLDAQLQQSIQHNDDLNDLNKSQNLTEEELAKARKARAAETVNVLGNLASVVGQQTIAGKGLAIATALINTYQGASEALKQKSTLPSPFDVVAKVANVATVIATGLQTVKSITAVKVPPVRGAGGGGGGVSIPSAPSVTSPSAAPQFNIIGGEPTNQLAGLLADQESQPVRAYVVSNDVSTAQSLDRNIVESATLG